MRMFYYKIHKSGENKILAVCDSGIIGKRFEEGNLALDVKKEFYGNERIGNDVAGLFQNANIINIVGKKIVSLAAREGWISKKNILKIKGIPHAQIIVL